MQGRRRLLCHKEPVVAPREDSQQVAAVGDARSLQDANRPQPPTRLWYRLVIGQKVFEPPALLGRRVNGQGAAEGGDGRLHDTGQGCAGLLALLEIIVVQVGDEATDAFIRQGRGRP